LILTIHFTKNSHRFKLKILNKFRKSLPDYKKFKEIIAKSMPYYTFALFQIYIKGQMW